MDLINDGKADNALQLQAALDALGAQGGGVLDLPAGSYALASPVEIPRGVTVRGQGYATRLVIAHTGHGLTSTCPINGSTAARVRLEALTIAGPGATSGGAGFAQVGGTFVTLERVTVSGMRWGVVLDQSELADIDLCDFEACKVGAWLVNGADFTQGAGSGFTNRITITRCQFNGGAWGIVDDGGGVHAVRDCNFNGQTTGAIRLAGAQVVTITGCEIESTPVGIHSDYRTSLLAGQVGQSSFAVERNVIACSLAALSLVCGSPVRVTDNLFACGAKPAVAGVLNCYRLDDGGGNVATGTGGLYDSPPRSLVDGILRSYGTAPPTRGNWSAGAIVHNTAPAVGKPISWHCVEAGAPGTWIAGPTL